MLESLAANLLNRILGSYVENFDSKQLNVGIWSGDVKLKNLKLKKESLDALNLPIDVRFGFLGELTLVVPWSSLKNKPVKILIEDVYLLCGPRDEDSLDGREDEERELRLKLQRLDELELLKRSQPQANEDPEKNESFTQSLITKIVDNLQVSIKNIHIRYEDMDGVFSKTPYSVGITLSELSAVSTDEKWEPSFISITKAITHKLLTLDSLCVYWNTNTTSIYGEDHEELFERLKDSISNKNGVPDHQFLLRPVTGSGRLTLNKSGASDECPHINIRLIFEEFGFDIDNCQYQDILYTMSKLHWYQKTLKFKRNRPNFTVGDDPKGWFRYAAQCVLQEIHDKNYYSSWDYIKWRREKREEYIQLWKKKLESSSKNQDSMNEFELEKLDELHRILSFDDIKFFRALARKEYLQDKLGSKSANPERKEPPANNKGGWFSSWWNGDSSGSQNDELLMTEEQKQELYDAIEFNEDQDVKDAIEIPRERVTTKVSCLLNRGSLSIKNKTKGIKLGEIIFEDCETGFYQRPDSFLATFKLDEFKIEDGSPNTLYKHIVSVKNLQLDEEGHTPELTEPFFQIAFEQNPLDDSADSKVDVKLRSMTVFYHVHFINEIIKLFKPPKRHLDTIGAIMNAAEATVEGWTVQTRMGLESILEDHKTINLNLDLQAPLIIIPLDPHIWDTPCAVLDAGHISIISDLVPKHKLREIKGMSPDEYEKIASRDIKRLMFDRFKLQLKDTQLLIGPDIRSTISNLSLNERDSNFVILDRMEIELDVDVSILPKAFNLPKVRTYGKLPILKLSLNDYQYKIIMQMIDKCIPDFGILSDDDDADNDDESGNDDESINVTGSSNESPQKSREITLLRQTMRNLEKMSKAELEQRLLQLKFDVEVIQLSLYKCVEAKTMQSNLLVNLIGNGLYLKFAKKAKDMEVHLDLHSFNIEDFIAQDEPEEFRKLIASTNIDKEGEKLDLFKLRYNRSQRIVTHHDTLIEVFDQDINLNMTELKFVLTPKSILTLLNYVLTTFTDPNATEMPVDALKHNSADVEDAPQKMNVEINMGNIIIVLNDESTKLATLELSAGEIKLFMLPEKMLLKAKLGGLDLTNEVYQELPRDSPMRKIISMSDHELAELTYETFDVANNNNNYSSKLVYKTGSMNINFVEDAVNRIVNYLAKFQKMKGLFDRAREAAYNQAGSIESVNNIKMNIVIKAPVITFPKLINPAKHTYDHVTFYLGEFFIDNNFVKSNDSYINQIKAGVRSGTLSSLFHMENNVTQNLHIIQNLDIHFDIEHINTPQHGQPKFKINGCFEPLYANLTELQLQFIYILSNSLPSAFIIDYDDNLSDIEDAALNVNSFISPEGHARVTPDVFEDSGREESFKSAVQEDEPGSAIELTFNAPHISLTLYTDTHDIYEIESKSITTVTLHDFGLAMKAKDDTSFRAETHVSSFTVEDTRREKDNKHPEIIPKIASDNYQFTASLTREKLEDFDLINLIATVDNPKVILALDYLFALKSFFDASLNVKAPARISESADAKADDSTQIEEKDCDQPLKFQYSLNIVESSIILLSDAADKNSEAIVFNVGQLLLTDQNIMSASANNVGMFLCKMGSFEDNRIRLLDDFSSSVVVDDRNSTADKLLTNIQFSVEPLTMRLSLRDIRLAMSIFNKAMIMARKHGLITDDIAKDDDMSTKYGTFSKEFKKTLSKYAPSVISSLSNLSTGDGKEQIDSKAILKAEKLNADIEGLRLVLIGDVHELPILDMNIKPFTVSAKDWSSDIEIITSIETYANIFNYSRSSWEPLVENIPISFHLSKSSENDAAMVFDVVSRKIAEVTLSSRSIALLSQIPEFLYDDKDLNPRGAEKPYKIFNDTGLDLNIWIAMKGSQEKRQLVNLKCGEKIDWEFEDWRKVRENLDTNSNMNILGVEVANKSYETILKIDTTSEGEEVYTLQPAVNGVHTRLACDLKLCEDNIKLVTIRSTFVLENSTSNDLEFMLNGDDSNLLYIKPGETRSVPAEKAFNSRLFIRPAGNYEWSDRSLNWKSLLSHPQSISCRSQSDKSLFYFEIDGKYDENEPLARIFPHMKIIVSSPLILENLLPYDMKYKLFWKPDEQNGSSENHMETRYLEKGARELIHSVTLEDFLLLALQPVEEGISMSDECLINTPMNSELKPERRVTLKYDNGQRLYLNLHYRSVDGSRAKIITIFASYVVLNGTSKDLQIEGDRGNICFTEVSLAEDSTRYSKPKMFSFDHQNDNHNRARIKFKDCDWSMKTSFDAIGQSVDLTMNIPNKNQESNIGVTVSEGEGRYALTKVIEIQPRYIVRNNLKVDLEVSEYGSNSVMTVSSGVSVPLYKMRNIINKHLILKFLGSDSEWSSPFMVKDIGSNYVKVLKNGSGHQLLKLDIILEKATIFIHISDAGANWPFSIRNFSDYEFIFYQRDPRMFDSDEDYDLYDDIGEIDYEPFYYRVPARSVMPYAWDYPAARQKKLILVARQRKREIQLAEIGNLKPMRLPARIEGEKSAIVDLNVVADGPTQALVISNYKPELSLYKLRTSQTSSSLSTDKSDKFEIQDEDKNIYTRVVVSFEGLGISLINTRLQELCYITLSGLELRYNESDLYQMLSFKLKWMQIDNQLFGGIYPNILYPTAIQNTSKELSNHPVLSGSVSKVKDDSHGVLYLKHATLLLQELSIQLDEDFLMALIEFARIPGASWVTDVKDTLCDEIATLPHPQELRRNNDIYFEVFHLQPTMLHLSFVRTEHLNVEEEKVPQQNALMFFVNVLTMALGNINNAPIKLNSLFMDNVKVPLPMLLSAIQTHYGQQFFYQIHKILGSADFLGNPVGLFNNVSSGVWDIFYEPYQGYMLNDRPQELGISIAKGGLSFVKKSVFGLSDSFARFTGSVAKGLSAATQDISFQEQRRLDQRKARANQSFNGFSSGATSFVNDLGSGLRGVAYDPFVSASREGVPGLLKGLTKGLVGLPTKTVIGMLDLASNVSEGIRNTTTVMDASLTSRVRLPRYVGYDQIIKPFNLRESQGQYWLKSANGGECISDKYLAHVVLPGKQMAVIVSMSHVIEVRLSSLEILWKVSYTDVRAMTLERAGLVITLKNASTDLFVPISDSDEKRFLYRNISIAVGEYNKYCQAEL
ncbi:LAFE_0D05226g1_1 [Lachancea fermentati]|uniref:Vacuolar protein sorting-associated protein n=1 Tax=Lachancea fermentati TaxID=4955 RepID=A0A1G4MB30_LACFM|nr:LAFE_0D05226g1_1 [Lachancea fermentati]